MPRLCFSVTGRASGCRSIQDVHENEIKHHTIVYASFRLHPKTQSRHLCHLHREMTAPITIQQEKPLQQAEAEQAYRESQTTSIPTDKRLASRSELVDKSEGAQVAQTQKMTTSQKGNRHNVELPLQQRQPNLSLHRSHPISILS